MSFGQEIAKARKKANLSQRELAERIKKEDGTSISPQYLNDIERDRRNPPSDEMIEQFAKILEIERDLLYILAGELPADIKNMEVQKVADAFKTFRKSLEKD